MVLFGQCLSFEMASPGLSGVSRCSVLCNRDRQRAALQVCEDTVSKQGVLVVGTRCPNAPAVAVMFLMNSYQAEQGH